jgi:hypothetical protein
MLLKATQCDVEATEITWDTTGNRMNHLLFLQMARTFAFIIGLCTCNQIQELFVFFLCHL